MLRAGRQVAVLAACLLLAMTASAAVRNVPGTYATIQAAINAADPGDTILVADGAYNESLNVDKAVILQSVNGPGSTTIWFDNNCTPVVLIAATGVRLGTTGQGFKIEQRFVGPDVCTANSPIMVDGSVVRAGGVTIAGNIIKGAQTDEGILVRPNLEGGTLRIVDNTFGAMAGATFSFRDAIHFYAVNYPVPIGHDLALHSSTVLIAGNKINDFDAYGIYFDDYIFNSQVTIQNCAINCVAVPSGNAYGIRFDDGGQSFCDVTIEGVQLSGAMYNSVDVDDMSNFCTLTLRNITATGFTHAGVYTDYVEYNGRLTVDNLNLTGDGTADYGLYLGEAYGDTVATVSNVTTAGFDRYGIYIYGAEYGSQMTITNLVAKGNNARYGVYVYYSYADCNVLVDNVRVSGVGTPGFTDYGFYFYECYYGSHVSITNVNVQTNNDAEYGAYIEYVYDGSTGEFANFVVKGGFQTCGFYLYEVEDGSSATVRNINVTSTNDVDYGFELDYVYLGSACTVTDVTATGFDNTGFYVDEVESGSTGTFSNLNVTGDGTADYGVYIDYVDYGSQATFNNVTAADFDYAGFYVDDVEDGSVLTVSNMTLTGNVADYGVYFNGYVDYGSRATFANVTATGLDDYGFYIYYVGDGSSLYLADSSFDGPDYGIYLDDYVEYGALFDVRGCQFTNITDTGIYFDDYVEYGSDALIEGCTIQGVGSANIGIEFYELYEGCTLRILNNTISGFTDTGIWLDDYVDYGSVASIFDNTITGKNADFGIWIYSADDGSDILVRRNTLTGFTDTGIMVDYDIDYGCWLDLTDNVIRGGPSDYGIWIDDGIDDGGDLTVSNNEIRRFTDTGIYLYDMDYGTDGWILGNTLVAEATGAVNGIELEYMYDGADLLIEGNFVSGHTDAGFWASDYMSDGAQLIIRGNTFNAGRWGCLFAAEIEDGCVVMIENNDVVDANIAGVQFDDYVQESQVSILSNRLDGRGANVGVHLRESVRAGAEVVIDDNCFADWDRGVRVKLIEDTAFVTAAMNDFTGTVTGVENVFSDAAHKVIAENNWWGQAAGPGAPAALVAGQVDFDPWLAAEADTDGDGVPTCFDLCPDTAAGLTADANGCEPCQLDPRSDTDGDGTRDCEDGCPNDPAKIAPGACGCGVADVDSDLDGTPDCADGCPADPAKIAPGDCGCGVADVDSDADGVADCVDGCPNDPAKLEPGACGCGVSDADLNANGIPDCLDQDTDGDDGLQPGQDIPGCGGAACGAGTLSWLPLTILGLLGMRTRARRRY